VRPPRHISAASILFQAGLVDGDTGFVGSPVLIASPFEIGAVFSPPGNAVSDREIDRPWGFDLVVEVNRERIEPESMPSPEGCWQS
jgi:hypothetical protein